MTSRIPAQAPLHWQGTLLWVAVISATLGLFDWLVTLGVLPVQAQFPDRPFLQDFAAFWLQLTVWLGLVLPTVALLLGWRRPLWRQVMGYYLLVVFAQVLTARILDKALFATMDAPTSTLYAALRLWQL
ncbi:MAG: hypothetical protein BRC58_05285 [Cyanobacteria bacterium QS_8_64_29]|nr:MAG: hypothetical protein BRC58_05285 [Cyanobacteria bacterium QS_8_64_29]